MRSQWFSRRWVLFALTLVAWVTVAVFHSIPSLACVLGFLAVISTFVLLALLVKPPKERRAVLEEAMESSPQDRLAHPSLPQTAAEVHKLSPAEFELFAAAVIVGLGQGHRFVERCGGRGDRGVDVRLANEVGLPVIVQCKRLAPHRSVKPSEMRDFGGTMDLHKAVQGFFVTTAKFSRGALQDKGGRIYPVDGPRMETYLQHYSVEIAEALDEIHRIQREKERQRFAL